MTKTRQRRRLVDAAVRRRSRISLRSCCWTGTQSRNSTSSTCVRNSSVPAHRDRKWSTFASCRT